LFFKSFNVETNPYIKANIKTNKVIGQNIAIILLSIQLREDWFLIWEFNNSNKVIKINPTKI
jgi:hypothetical protein